MHHDWAASKAKYGIFWSKQGEFGKDTIIHKIFMVVSAWLAEVYVPMQYTHY